MAMQVTVHPTAAELMLGPVLERDQKELANFIDEEAARYRLVKDAHVSVVVVDHLTRKIHVGFKAKRVRTAIGRMMDGSRAVADELFEWGGSG